MSKRRTNAELADVQAIHDRTNDVARAIAARVDPNDESPVSVSASSYWSVKADYQRGVADDIILSFRTKDPVEAERVAAAMVAAWRQTEGGGQ